jgi:hypothetical protein
MQRICMPTALRPPTHNTRTATSDASANAASTVTAPRSSRRWCSTPG